MRLLGDDQRAGTATGLPSKSTDETVRADRDGGGVRGDAADSGAEIFLEFSLVFRRRVTIILLPWRTCEPLGAKEPVMLKRFWKGRPRGLSELPAEVKGHNLYATGTARVYLREALLSCDREWYWLTMECGQVDFFRRMPDGKYQWWPEGPSFGDMSASDYCDPDAPSILEEKGQE